MSLLTMNKTFTTNSLLYICKKIEKIAIDTVFEYFKDNNNLFDFSNDKVTNFVTDEFIDSELTENLICSITIGEGVYSELKLSQLDKKTVTLLDPTTRTKVVIKSAELQKTSYINK